MREVRIVGTGRLLVRAILRLLRLAAGGQLELVHVLLHVCDWVGRLGQQLVRVVLGVGVLWEVLAILGLND